MPAPTELKNPPPKMERPLIYEVKPTRVRVSHNFKKKPLKVCIITLNLELHIKRNISKSNSGY